MTSRFLMPFNRDRSSSRAVQPLFDLQREFSQLFDEMFNLSSNAFQTGFWQLPKLDARENDQELCISAELPGVKADDLDLRIRLSLESLGMAGDGGPLVHGPRTGEAVLGGHAVTGDGQGLLCAPQEIGQGVALAGHQEVLDDERG